MKKSLLVMLILGIIFVAGCSKVYVCYDGTTQNAVQKCPTVPSPYISLKEAQQAVDNYGSAYALAKGDRFTRVNLFAQETNYISDVLFTSIKDGSVSSVRLEIDGKTREISCLEGCSYLEGINPGV